MEDVSVFPASAMFFLGGVLFWQVSGWTRRSGTSASQLVGMMLDFVPEAIVLGATAAADSAGAYLLAGLIALQNMPEGFGAFHEMQSHQASAKRLWTIFLAAPLAGPLAAWLGFAWPSISEEGLGLVMFFCSGGILYLIFEDIAPQAHLRQRDFPAIGAVLGFLLGMVGAMLAH